MLATILGVDIFAIPLDTRKAVRVRAVATSKTYLEGSVSSVGGLERLRDHPRRLFSRDLSSDRVTLSDLQSVQCRNSKRQPDMKLVGLLLAN